MFKSKLIHKAGMLILAFIIVILGTSIIDKKFHILTKLNNLPGQIAGVFIQNTPPNKFLDGIGGASIVGAQATAPYQNVSGNVAISGDVNLTGTLRQNGVASPMSQSVGYSANTGWNRILTMSTTNLGASVLLSVQSTRNSYVSTSTFMITSSHNNKGIITQLTSLNYAQLNIRLLVDSPGDMTVDIDFGGPTSASFTAVPLSNATLTLNIAQTDGSTIPAGYITNESFTTNANTFRTQNIVANGTVGIGTANPTATLDVNGDARFGCRPGFWAVADGRICVEITLRGPNNAWDAIGVCKSVPPGNRVCTHTDLQQACGAGIANPYGAAKGWYGDHGVATAAGGNWDDEYGAWNSNGCNNNNDDPAYNASDQSFNFRCCY